MCIRYLPGSYICICDGDISILPKENFSRTSKDNEYPTDDNKKILFLESFVILLSSVFNFLLDDGGAGRGKS